MSILSKKKTSTLWILLVQGGSYSYKVELTFTIDLNKKVMSKYAEKRRRVLYFGQKSSILKAFGSKKDTVSDISDVLLFSGIPDIVFNGI